MFNTNQLNLFVECELSLKRNLIKIDKCLSIFDKYYDCNDIKISNKVTEFLIGIYTCRIQNRLFKINICLIPKDRMLVSIKDFFNKPPTIVKRLKNIRNIKEKKAYTPYKKHMEAIANEYYVVGSPKDDMAIKKLRKKLRRYRVRHLDEKRFLNHQKFSESSLGDDLRLILNVLHGPRKTRSFRKRMYRAKRKEKAILKKKYDLIRLKNFNMSLEKEKRKIIRQEKKEANLYLERLKTYEKACKDTDINPLDLLFERFL